MEPDVVDILVVYDISLYPYYSGTAQSGGLKPPDPSDMEFNNLYWQKVTTSNGIFYLYAAYLDIRATDPPKPIVRVLSITDRPAVVKTNCFLWFQNDTKPVISEVCTCTLGRVN